MLTRLISGIIFKLGVGPHWENSAIWADVCDSSLGVSEITFIFAFFLAASIIFSPSILFTKITGTSCQLLAVILVVIVSSVLGKHRRPSSACSFYPCRFYLFFFVVSIWWIPMPWWGVLIKDSVWNKRAFVQNTHPSYTKIHNSAAKLTLFN